MMWALVRRREAQDEVRWPQRYRGVDGLFVKD
jgi:hypothetical protein